MDLRPLLAALLMLTMPWAGAVQAESVVRFGASQPLADGARALFTGDYATGIRLTLAGLEDENSRIHKAAGLSNLCAGYVGARQYAEAIDACTRAIELRNTNWRAFNNRALAFLATGNLAAARSDVQSGLALSADSRQLLKVDAMIEARAQKPLLASAEEAR